MTTTYLVDTQNPTGYAQVVYEAVSGSTALNYEQSHTFMYGLELINEARSYVQNGQSANSRIYFNYDGHGSVRALTDQTGAVTDTYDYDAFGNVIHSTGTTPNNYLFSCEQFDPDLHLYYNRARYLNTSTGRFWNMEELMVWCEKHAVNYVFGFARNKRLRRIIGRAMQQAKQEHRRTGKPARVFCEFAYRTKKSWSRARRVVAKAEQIEGKENPRYLVTSLGKEAWPAQQLYEQLY